MSLIGIAFKCGTTTNTVEDLLRGRVGVGIAGKLQVTSSSLQDFLRGRAGVGLASKLGTTTATLQELRNKLGEEGARGFLLGLACADVV